MESWHRTWMKRLSSARPNNTVSQSRISQDVCFTLLKTFNSYSSNDLQSASNEEAVSLVIPGFVRFLTSRMRLQMSRHFTRGVDTHPTSSGHPPMKVSGLRELSYLRATPSELARLQQKVITLTPRVHPNLIEQTRIRGVL